MESFNCPAMAAETDDTCETGRMVEHELPAGAKTRSATRASAASEVSSSLCRGRGRMCLA